jgi:adenylate cyclase
MNHHRTHILYLIRRIFRDETRKGNLARLGIAAVLAFLVIGLRMIFPGDLDSDQLLKTFYSLRGSSVPPADLVIVNIDDESYRKLGVSYRKPFPRSVSGKALMQIMNEAPKLVILDLDVPEEADEEEGTALLARAMKQGPVSIARFNVKAADPNSAPMFSAPEIREAATYELPMLMNYWFGMAKYIHVNPVEVHSGQTPADEHQFIAPLREQVSNTIAAPAAFDMINFYGPAGTIRSFSLWEFFSEERRIPEGYFKDKVVLVGFKSNLRERGNSAKETFHVPVRSGAIKEMYGVEIHATTVANLLEGNWLRRITPLAEYSYLWIVIFIFVLGILQLEPLHALIFGVTYLAVWFAVTYFLFASFNFFAPGVYLALIASPIIFGGAACSFATLHLRELRELKKTLGLS